MSERATIIQLLVRLAGAAADSDDESEALDGLRRSLLNLGSETEDNLKAVERLEWVSGKYARGLGIQGTGATLAEVMNWAEGIPVPEQLKMAFPELKQEEWDAALRVTVLILSAFQKRKPS